MKITRRDGLKLMGATALATGPMKAFAGSHGAMHEVEMLNKAPDSNERQVFNPPVLQIAKGDTVKFVATDRGHNSEANDDMLPEGAEGWSGKINDDVEHKFEVAGVYGYHCTPHQSAGMVGLILVGDVTQEMLDAAGEVRQRGRARQRMEEYLAQASEMIAAS
ncbi:pseudoazurin [Alphaproteobacteria bacterium GH1-50]|uniref:Pseudoazurin n=1 Tax=Kangsaoukella pontilimi TaxID=2691042 RepID=A0A7C9MGR1_9RHOB|nr:pseudoazurin [Kangsaoukella pontilimi]MXQ09712.1 pseudoazurin [Kangsaoukella pontilimi]